MKCTIGLLLMLCMLSLLGSNSASALESKVQLSITPQLCNLDIVNDGSNQIMYVPSLDCQKALPLVPAVPGPEEGVSSFVSAPIRTMSDEQATQFDIRPQVEGTLSPIAAKVDQKDTTSRSTYLTPTVLGVGAALGATAIGIDLALFEFQYSRKLVQWTRKHTLGRLSKNKAF